MSLNEKELNVIKSVAASTNAILQQIPVEKVDEVQDAFIQALSDLKDAPKPTIVETIKLGLDAIDAGAQIAPDNKQGNNFRSAMAVIKGIFSIISGQGGGIFQLFSLVGKGKKALK